MIRTRSKRLLVSGLCVFSVLCSVGWAAKPPRPLVSLPLEGMGFYGFSKALLATDASLLTANYVDATHVLLTFNARTLVSRSSEDKADDDTRNIAALLIELPSGKVLARTQWHVFDYGRYLWPMGHGRFLLRIRDSLRLIDPLAGLAEGDAFQQQQLIHESQSLLSLYVSTDGKLIMVETAERRAAASSAATPPTPSATPSATVGGQPVVTPSAPAMPPALATRPAPQHVTISFLRVVEAGPKKTVSLAAAGSLRSPESVYIPVEDSGYLLAKETKRDGWSVGFDRFSGETREMAPVDSTCMPRLQFVSRSEYAVLACRGGDRLSLGSYDLSGREAWEERFITPGSMQTFAFAPEAGRFVFSRVIDTAPPELADHTPVPNSDPVSTQDIRVYGNNSGDLLLEVKTGSALRTGQNFDLSRNGTRLLVVHDGLLEEYALPALSKKDVSALAAAKLMEPPADDGPVQLKRMVRTVVASDEQNRAVDKAEAKVAASAVSADDNVAAPLKVAMPASVVEPGAGAVGDDAAPRKRPTLLNPGEKPEFDDSKAESKAKKNKDD